MKKLIVLLALIGFGAANTSFAQTVVPEVQDPSACTGSAGTCGRWYELTERENPDACLAARQNREECNRWYAVEEKATPIREVKKIDLNQVIYFDFNKSTIKSESYGILDDVATVLKGNSNIQRVRIEGHTDAIGSDGYNEKLSDRRAGAVKNYLIDKGIGSDRLESIGYGESRPVADNNSEEGRAKNRRTEFNIK